MSLKPGQVDLPAWNRHWSSCVPTTSLTAAVLAASLRPFSQILTVLESHFSGLKPHKAKNVSPEGILVFAGPAPTFPDACASKLLCVISFNSFKAGLFLAIARLRRTFSSTSETNSFQFHCPPMAVSSFTPMGELFHSSLHVCKERRT